jgi:hypothetical protein
MSVMNQNISVKLKRRWFFVLNFAKMILTKISRNRNMKIICIKRNPKYSCILRPRLQIDVSSPSNDHWKSHVKGWNQNHNLASCTYDGKLTVGTDFWFPVLKWLCIQSSIWDWIDWKITKRQVRRPISWEHVPPHYPVACMLTEIMNGLHYASHGSKCPNSRNKYRNTLWKLWILTSYLYYLLYKLY